MRGRGREGKRTWALTDDPICAGMPENDKREAILGLGAAHVRRLGLERQDEDAVSGAGSAGANKVVGAGWRTNSIEKIVLKLSNPSYSFHH